MKLKITSALIEKLLVLKNGDAVVASSLHGEWVDALLREGVLTRQRVGSGWQLRSCRPDLLETYLRGLDERLGDLALAKATFAAPNEASRASQAEATGNSKIKLVRSCPGFPVNSYQPIACRLNGHDVTVCPDEGSFLFVTDWNSFEIPADVVVVGIENMENFRLVSRQRQLFESEVSASSPLLFVSRYPQSRDLCKWLQGISNRYVHFGDFDLAGISIFLTEFLCHLGQRASFLIPADIEARLARGSRERYEVQYGRFKGLSLADSRLQKLIGLIHRYGRCYDQEGYIGGR